MKRKISFAQDRTATGAVLASLDALMLHTPELNWVAVVDGAFDYPTNETLPYTTAGENCFGSAPFDGLEKAAPWLVPISPNEQGRQFLTSLIRHCSGRPMLSFVATPRTVSLLNDSWAHLHWVRDDDGNRMLLRFADTRILASLPQVLTNQQWAAYTASLSHWWFIDREGKLAEISIGEGNILEKEVAISQIQMNELMQLAEPDSVIDLIIETMPDIIPEELHGSRLFEFVKATCLLAKQYGIEAFPDIVSMAVASFLTGGKCNSNAALITLLKTRTWNDGELGDAILAVNIIEDIG